MEKLVLFLFACTLFACNNYQSPKNDKVIDPAQMKSWGNQSSSELRGYSTLAPERFLGCNFNLLRASRKDALGFTLKSSLNLSKLKSEKHFLLTSGEAPEIKSLLTEELAYSIEKDSVEFKFGFGIKGAKFAFNRTRSIRQEQASYKYNVFTYKVENVAEIDGLEDIKDYVNYVDDGFLKDVRGTDLSLSQLVNTYGTHVVARYNLGPYMDLTIFAQASKFSLDELKNLALSFKGDYSLSPADKRKIEQYSQYVTIKYRQGGSSYTPGKVIFDPKVLFGTKVAEVHTLDISSWQNGFQNIDKTFLSLDFDEHGFIPITDLLTDLTLKVKYATAIILEQRKRLGQTPALNFVLSDPKTGALVKFQGSELVVNSNYESDNYYAISIGASSGDALEEAHLRKGADESGEWVFRLEDNGLWVIEGVETGEYLCRDFELRKSVEDTGGLRYWLLNPIIPSSDGNMSSLSNLLVQVTRK